jgi:hypothetical protein
MRKESLDKSYFLITGYIVDIPEHTDPSTGIGF